MQWMPKIPLLSPKPFSSDRKKDEDLNTWVRTVPTYVRHKLTRPKQKVIVAASFLEGSATRWLNGLVQQHGYDQNFDAWAQTQTLEDYVRSVYNRWHDPQGALKATDPINSLCDKRYKNVREITDIVERLLVVPRVRYDQQVLLTNYLRYLPSEVRTKLVDEAYVDQHNFTSFGKKSLDIEAKLGSAHQNQGDGRRKKLPQDWKNKGQLTFVDHDGQETEIDDFPDYGDEIEHDGVSETSNGGVVEPIKEKARGTGKKKVVRSTGQGDQGIPAWVKLGLDYEVWRDRVARGTCMNCGNYGHTSRTCRAPPGRSVNGSQRTHNVAACQEGKGDFESPRISNEFMNLHDGRYREESPRSSSEMGAATGGSEDRRSTDQLKCQAFIFRYHNAQTPPFVGRAALGGDGSPVSHVMRLPYRGELSKVALQQHFFCPCCADVLRNPMTLPCMHDVCHSCLEKGRKKTPPGSQVVCPVVGCYIPIHGTPTPNTQLRVAIGKVPIRCVNGISFDVTRLKYKMLKIDVQPLASDDFCRQILSYENLDVHMSTCQYRLVFCGYRSEGCTEICLLRDVASHESYCPWRMSVCAGCQEEVCEARMDEHLENVCPMAMVHCTYVNYGCPHITRRSDLQKHVSSCAFGDENVLTAFKALLEKLEAMKRAVSEERANALKYQQEAEYYRQRQGIR
ncbi:hypothetical protein CBR_g4192 [Chara braunii]|uniref:CCHC-type domain-containing protein n=1 Tax=Chara braunii TaxID=69332 RepID=A0A388KHH9_CHABU|nr:hypothetical protein CBR_g4192 [Chara braunii]|eukprot:GBG69499.1 hypothetical protein CBR_g4192 [Chara braunii]